MMRSKEIVFFLVYLDFLLLIINVTYRNLLEFFE